MLLTDDEIEALAMDDDGSDDLAFARAIEAAILAKLASAELPEPATVTVLSETPYYTADQIREAFAQGAASQLSAEPMFWVRIRSDGMYEGPIHSKQIEKVRAESGGRQELFTRKEPK